MSIVQEVKEIDMTKGRATHQKQDCWDVEALYPSWESWEEDMKLWGREGQSPHWPELAPFRTSWSQSPEHLRALIELCFKLDRHLSKLYTYAHLRHDEDAAEEVAKKAYVRITSLIYSYQQECAWIEPELLKLPDDKLAEFLESEALRDVAFYLEKIIRSKPHTLTAEIEELLAMGGKALQTSSQAFSAFNNADLKFEPVTDSKGEQRDLTHGKFLLYLRGTDRKLREGAFKNLHRGYSKYENTLCELLNGQMQKHAFAMKARKYSSCVEAALFPNQVDTKVYHSLIEAVRASLPSLHRYTKLRKKVLGLETLHLYDMNAPLVAEVDLGMPYDKAAEEIVESVAVLGKEYQEVLRVGLTSGRWVDRYENARKRSGAYSSGCYDSMPYILMNYHGSFNDVMTLSHEAGHSMHSWLSRENQPYQYSQYSIFVAEVASTFHEELLLQHLLKKCTSKEQKAYLINQKLDDMRATLLRQTMFAEFELKLHQWAESGMPLTPALLKEEYRKLNADYYGPEVVLDVEADIEWARIPHFYYNFYVYQYATGISAALALAQKVLNEGPEARDRYLAFLSSGCSLYPLDTLKLAGVDMRGPEPVISAMKHFDDLLTELEKQL